MLVDTLLKLPLTPKQVLPNLSALSSTLAWNDDDEVTSASPLPVQLRKLHRRVKVHKRAKGHWVVHLTFAYIPEEGVYFLGNLPTIDVIVELLKRRPGETTADVTMKTNTTRHPDPAAWAILAQEAYVFVCGYLKALPSALVPANGDGTLPKKFGGDAAMNDLYGEALENGWAMMEAFEVHLKRGRAAGDIGKTQQARNDELEKFRHKWATRNRWLTEGRVL